MNQKVHKYIDFNAKMFFFNKIGHFTTSQFACTGRKMTAIFAEVTASKNLI
jgi:hypothetical protein